MLWSWNETDDEKSPSGGEERDLSLLLMNGTAYSGLRKTVRKNRRNIWILCGGFLRGLIMRSLST